MVGSTTPPGTPACRSPSNSWLGSAIPARPVSAISNSPSSPVGPNRCFVARSSRSAWWRSPSNDSTVSTTCSSTRGPARVPSLVTWPTRTVATADVLATDSSCDAHSRTWVTVPAVDPSSGSRTVWIESTTTTSGSRSAIARSTFGSEVSESSHNPGSSAPRRSARRRTCCADSSADTSRALMPVAAIVATAWRRSVDLPIPGSPPTSVTEPGTSPPVITRSSSASPVALGAAAAVSTSAIGRGASTAWPAVAARRPLSAGTVSSTNVFQASHDGHRPLHRSATLPHSVQR